LFALFSLDLGNSWSNGRCGSASSFAVTVGEKLRNPSGLSANCSLQAATIPSVTRFKTPAVTGPYARARAATEKKRWTQSHCQWVAKLSRRHKPATPDSVTWFRYRPAVQPSVLWLDSARGSSEINTVVETYVMTLEGLPELRSGRLTASGSKTPESSCRPRPRLRPAIRSDWSSLKYLWRGER